MLTFDDKAAMRTFGDVALGLFDKNKSGPLSTAEIKNIRLATMPYLLEDGRRSDLALLISRLIETVDHKRVVADGARRGIDDGRPRDGCVLRIR